MPITRPSTNCDEFHSSQFIDDLLKSYAHLVHILNVAGTNAVPIICSDHTSNCYEVKNVVKRGDYWLPFGDCEAELMAAYLEIQFVHFLLPGWVLQFSGRNSSVNSTHTIVWQRTYTTYLFVACRRMAIPALEIIKLQFSNMGCLHFILLLSRTSLYSVLAFREARR